ncbi:Flagellar protein FlaG [hydrothermal vent metagenome]|uniref:Flagellar protein FlaG n=1 Tax=hydrothermal vent metagenome TaxID=652676 RepID=A0A3B1A2Z7_9ZZZZ
MATHTLANVSTMMSQAVKTNTGIKTTSIGVSSSTLQQDAAEQSVSTQVEVSKETVDRVVHQLETQSQSLRRDLLFNVDDSTGRVIVTVRDSETNEVIRQIPSEELLALSQHLADALEDDASGFLFESKA